jgi:hypothetical protein
VTVPAGILRAEPQGRREPVCAARQFHLDIRDVALASSEQVTHALLGADQ